MSIEELPKMKTRTNDEVISFALPKDMKQRIQRLKELKHVNTSEWIRRIVLRELEKLDF